MRGKVKDELGIRLSNWIILVKGINSIIEMPECVCRDLKIDQF